MAKTKNPLAIASKAIDPTLNALFASSSGPVTAPPKSRYSGQQEKKPSSRSAGQAEDGEDAEEDDEVLSEISEELDYGDDDAEEASGTVEGSGDDEDEDNTSAPRGTMSKEEAGDAVAAVAAAIVESGKTNKDRKRKRKDDNEGLEGKYLAELTKHEEAEPVGKRQKGEEGDSEEEEDDDDDDEKPPLHETLTQDSKKSELEKAARTVFLANVSSEVISSKTAKKTLMKHLSSVLDTDASPPEKIESIRFRSLAFAAGAMPKRAAYITKSVMGATTKSANAYAVFSTTAAARKVVAQLNGTEVLDRHLRVDSVAHPTPTDHRRCVFVGNLGFVDDETVVNTNADGKTVEKKRTKVPADVEEGLWRTFGKQGRVENVRVVRDSKTRVGKGFAYVQFYDGNDVEAALLLDGKKFPPMLPRALRVTRAKDPRKTAQAMEKARAKAEAADSRASGSGSGRTKYEYRPKATPEEQAAAGRASKLLGRSGAAHMKRGRRGEGAAARDGAHAGGSGSGGFKTPHDIIFEGRRASARDALPKDLKLGKKGKSKGGKPKGRGARRAAAWKSKK